MVNITTKEAILYSIIALLAAVIFMLLDFKFLGWLLVCAVIIILPTYLVFGKNRTVPTVMQNY